MFLFLLDRYVLTQRSLGSYYIFLRLLPLSSYVYFPSSTVKSPRHAAYDAALAERRAETWACANRTSMKETAYSITYTIKEAHRSKIAVDSVIN